MTKLRVDPGICGLSAIVEVNKKAQETFHVTIHSDCPAIQKLGEEIADLELVDIFKPILSNPVYQMASLCVQHASCPVSSGILKAIEVEAGMALPKEASIKFLN
jgi:hypothetical protein